jgi:F-type H+-transporting ATPase subunit epsilon
MRFSITTPLGSVVEADIDEVTAPGQEGELGVLPEHIPLMTALKPGVLTYHRSGGGHTHVLAVGEGFLQVAPQPPPAAAAAGDAAARGPAGTGAGPGVGSPAGAGDGNAAAARPVDRVLVLVDRAVTAASIDRAAAQADLARAEAELAGWKQDLDGAYAALLVRRDWALAQVNASERLAPH